jgi:hypothetical protein
MILINDVLFPSKYAKWRIEEIKAFIDAGDADILVSKVDYFAGVSYEVDHDIMREYYGLDRYNILIFDPRYNYLNKYNTKINGMRFNHKCSQSYMYTLSETFNIGQYDTIYHIFLSSYNRFKAEFRAPPEKQIIHLYPGGGYSSPKSLVDLPKNINVVCTQPFCTFDVRQHGIKSYVNVYGSSLLPQHHTISRKRRNDKTLRVCFATMGQGVHKGSNSYATVAETYKKLHPNDDIEFVFIGSTAGLTKSLLPMTFLKPMSQSDLDSFYHEKIDILINVENGAALNGWPLGIEAALQGVVLLTTDVHRANKHFQYTEDMLQIIPSEGYNQIVKHIKTLYDDRDLLLSMSQKIQDHSVQVFSYQNQQQKIFDFVDEINSRRSMNNYRTVCPEYDHESTIFRLKPACTSPMIGREVSIIEPDIYQFIFTNLETQTPFSLARYNDGEWIAALKIKANGLYDVHFPKWKESGQKFVDANIMPIIQSTIDYPIGISSEVMKKPYMMEQILPYMSKLQVFDGGLFAKMSIDGSLLKVFELLKGRNVIIVGPAYMSKLNKHFPLRLVVTHPDAVWNHFDEIHARTKLLIDELDKPVVLYACSFVAKVLIDKFHKTYQDKVTQLDIGAALDVYCEVNSRPWHATITNKGKVA